MVYYWVDFDGESYYENSITEQCLIEEMYEHWKNMLIAYGHPIDSEYLNVDTFIDYFVVNNWATTNESILS